MIKVIIADDEEKIRQLIVKLINWHELDMEVVFVSSNGLESLEAIQKYKPDIVISDIRMPGMDGLELIKKARELGIKTDFIIISGYRHFEYAQKAIQYGVEDYLLKPIKKVELNNTLKKMQERYREKSEQITYEERVRRTLKNDAGRLRTTYLSMLLYGDLTKIRSLTMHEVNLHYHYQFGEGLFQIVCIKFDRIATDSENLKFIADKTDSLVMRLFHEQCIEQELYIEGSFVYLLLNYEEQIQKQVRKQIKTLLSELMVLESILKDMIVTIAAGVVLSDFGKIFNLVRNARKMIEERLIQGGGKVISELPENSLTIVDSEVFYEFNRDLVRALESLNTECLKPLLNNLKDSLLSTSGITGHEILQMTKEVCNLFLITMRNQELIVENAECFLSDFSVKAEDCWDVNTLFALLDETLSNSYEKAVQTKKLEDGRPIRIAKKYMEEHYMDSITMEDVSAIAGFSTTYFSSLFKRETGMTFLEYLLYLRMEEAKRLLKKTNINVSNICQDVGYSDIKYFTKTFIKYTGLKPTAYRKIYS